MSPSHWKSLRFTPSHALRLGIAAFFLLIAALASNNANANGIFSTSPPPLTTLVKFDDRDYSVTTADWVSLDAEYNTTVRKIEFGRVTDVNIATTSTGTYSSDALVSPNVLYPGITVEPVKRERRRGWGIGPGFVTLEGIGTSIYALRQNIDGSMLYTRSDSAGMRSCVLRQSLIACFRSD
jgi:hypothetical protein